MAEKGKFKKVQIAKLPSLIDVCDDGNGTPSFLLYNDGKLEIAGEKMNGNIIYTPPPAESMPWALPRAHEVIRYFGDDTDAKLFEDIMMCLCRNTELPDPNLYSFLTAWILHTHIIEKFTFSPIIIFYAVAARGKTRTGCLLTWMARRGLHVETIREPDIFRKAERFCVNLFIDVADVWKKAERLNAEDILLSRFKRDVIISRVTNPEKNGFDDTRHYRPFGPTIIATNESPSYLLESRGVNIRMLESSRQFDNDIDERDFLEFRERCTAFRARWMSRKLSAVPKPARHRLGDILRPIAQIMATIAPNKVHELTALIKVFQNDYTNALADTPEGKIIKALLGLEVELVQGIILTQKIANKINDEVPERYHMSVVSVGKRMGSLGFKSGMVGGDRGFYYDQQLLNRLAQQYGCLDTDSITQATADKADIADTTDTAGTADVTYTAEDVDKMVDEVLNSQMEIQVIKKTV